MNRKLLTLGISAVLSMAPLIEGCSGHRHYYRPSMRYLQERHSGLDPRLDLQYHKLNNWYGREMERAERRGYRIHDLYRIERRYCNGLRQLERGRRRRHSDFQRRLDRDISSAVRRVENIERRIR